MLELKLKDAFASYCIWVRGVKTFLSAAPFRSLQLYLGDEDEPAFLKKELMIDRILEKWRSQESLFLRVRRDRLARAGLNHLALFCFLDTLFFPPSWIFDDATRRARETSYRIRIVAGDSPAGVLIERFIYRLEQGEPLLDDTTLQTLIAQLEPRLDDTAIHTRIAQSESTHPRKHGLPPLSPRSQFFFASSPLHPLPDPFTPPRPRPRGQSPPSPRRL